MDKTKRPGDLLLDRTLPGVDEATREVARDRWKRLIRALLKVATRLTLEEQAGGDSPNSDRRLRIPSLP